MSMKKLTRPDGKPIFFNKDHISAVTEIIDSRPNRDAETSLMLANGRQFEVKEGVEACLKGL